MAFLTQYEVDQAENARKRNAFNQIGEGVEKGVNSYRQSVAKLEENRRRALDEKRQQFKDNLQYAAMGVTPSDQEQADMQNAGYSQSLLDRLSTPLRDTRDRELRIKEEDRALGNSVKRSTINANNAKAMEAGLPIEDSKEVKTHEAKKRIDNQIETEKAANSKKPLSADIVLKINEGANVPKMLENVAAMVENNQDLFHPIKGPARAMNPWDEQAKTGQSLIDSSAQAFGKYMEGGVLRKEDEAKYKKMFPQNGDTPAVAKNKLAIVQKLLIDKLNGDVGALHKSGYDISGINHQFQPPQVPQVLRGHNGAQAAQKPKTVVQGGHTYVLNEQTGEYE